MIRAVDVRIGARYSVHGGAVDGVVEIEEFVDRCLWLAKNISTGGRRYVVLGDLKEECKEVPVAAPPAIERDELKWSGSVAAGIEDMRDRKGRRPIEYRRRAAGDVD